MLKCAILGAQGLYALYRKAELALLAPSSSQYFVYLPLSIQRLQARSKYIHVCSGAPSLAHKACTRYTERPNLRFWLPALRSTLFICHFRYNACRHAASTSMYAQVRHPWRTGLYALYRKAELALLASCSQLSAPSSQLPAPGSRLPAPSSQHPAPSSLHSTALCLSATFDTTLAGTQ